jgi:hypothetical protein
VAVSSAIRGLEYEKVKFSLLTQIGKMRDSISKITRKAHAVTTRLEQYPGREVFKSGEPRTVEERIVIDGEERALLSTKVPIYDTSERSDAETPVGVSGIASEITEVRRKER